MDDDASVLSVSFSGYEEHYDNKQLAKENVKYQKNLNNVTLKMIFNRDSQNATFDYDFVFNNATVYNS